jgi:hypothetical protein
VLKIKDFIRLVKVELALCLAVPILTAVLLYTGPRFSTNHYYMIIIGLFCVFAYGIIKMLFTLKKNGKIFSEENINKPKSTAYQIFIVIVAIIMPVVGLALNNSGMFFGNGSDGIFGDFSNLWFYIIAFLNGLIMLVNMGNDRRSLALLYLKTVGFTYIIYFTIIFLPLMPFGLFGIVFYGLGILILAPITVFVTELFQIIQDFRKLKATFRTGVIAAILLGVITLPAILTVNFSLDKVNFHKSLTYLSADSWNMPTISISRLKTTLKHADNALDASRGSSGIFPNGTTTPIISRYYQTVALEGKVLSPDTVNRLRQIFSLTNEAQPANTTTEQIQNGNLISVNTSSEFDNDLGIYKTWMDLEIRNDSDRSLAEYRADFLLRDGCFIKDYYLYVGHERKQGILADKRAALITYNNIIRTPRDPGIIYYNSDNAISLRVYPFDRNEVRKTGFLVWHSQNEVIIIEGREIYLNAAKSIDKPLDMQGISFIPASYKKNLPTYERQPVYCFIIDASENSPYEEHQNKIAEYVSNTEIRNSKIYMASYKVYDNNKSSVKCVGGFNLPLAMEMIFKEYEHSALWFPIIIAVSDNINKAPAFQKSNLAKRFPESGYYYNLGYDLHLTPYSFADNKRQDIIKYPILSNTLSYNGLVVADNDKSETVISGNFGSYTDNAYHNAFVLQAKSSVYSNDERTQIELVRNSFRQRVLTKYTAFTVLETVEQENALLELQAKFLNSGGQSNHGQNAPAVMMDEPSLLICVLMALVFAICGRNKLRRRKKSIINKGNTDDIWLNTLGACIGYAVWRLLDNKLPKFTGKFKAAPMALDVEK